VLQDDAGKQLTFSSSTSQTFSNSYVSGATYSVSVMTQPSGQNCTLSNNTTGTITANVTITVACAAVSATYTIGGIISGLSGTVVLQNNSGDNLTISTNGTFTFATPLSSGSTYSVTVLTQPSGQTCTVTNGTGTATSTITSVSVTCSATTYTIGGSVTGLSGTGLVLQDNGADNLTIAADGSFTFATALAAGSTYSVKVLTQPSNPTQTCTVSNGTGTADADVTNVSVTCSTTTYSIGGTLSGLTSSAVVLQDNGGDNLSLNANGSFTFATKIAAGSSYAVAVLTQPAGQLCTVKNGNGTANANVTNVSVTCAVSSGNAINQTFFGASFNFFTTWPPTDGLGHVATLGVVRLWDDKVKWGQINTASGVYDWSTLDSYISMAQSQNLNVLYTFGDTPDYAGTIPGGNIHCLSPSDYSCSPPNDVNSDGSGTDSFFSTFVTALVNRYKGEISYYELWNEPDCPCYFAGTQAQMVRMNQDASDIIHSIDPNAKTLSPSGHVWTMNTWFPAYIQAGGAATFDIVNMHMRSNGTLNLVPENFLGTYANIVAGVAANNLGNLPLWDSEHGIKADENFTDPDELAGYAARELVLRASVGVPRQYVYSWDDNAPVGLQGNLGGTAYDTVAGWLIGHTISACVASSTVYTCNVDDGQIVWDTAQSCSNGVCTTSNYTYPPSYTFQTDLTGSKTALSGKTVPIGYKPIFLTAQ
jgi:Cellulase (glycosyl hydrolase family 5)